MARYDLHFQARAVEEQGTSTRVFTFGYRETIAVKGFQMLINIWLKVLFTRQGSDPTNLLRGTAYTNLIGSSTSLAEAEDVVRISIEQCNDQVRALQQNDTSLTDRERLADAKLYRYVSDVSAPGFDAYVEITNQAGERLQFLLPEQGA